MTFLVGSDHVVHTKACRHRREDALPYTTKAKTHPELRAWVANPDFKDRHFAPPILTVCPDCIEDV